MTSQVLLSRWSKTKCHQCAVIRRVGFVDAYVRDSLRSQSARERVERLLVRYREHDGVHAARRKPVNAFVCCMHNLGCKEPYRQVLPHENVVGQDIQSLAVSRLNASTMSCPKA